MVMKLSNADIIKLLPNFMRNDPAVKAFAKSVNTLIRNPGANVNRLREWDQINAMTSEELDELAWEMSLEWYDPTVSIENKRKTIQSAIMLKEKSGTKWAVIEAIKAAYGADPEILEWYEYGGTPGHFKVNLNATKVVDFNRVIKAINYVKRISAHLDGVELILNEQSPLYIGFTAVYNKEYTISMNCELKLPDWIEDENGQILSDESGNIIVL